MIYRVKVLIFDELEGSATFRINYTIIVGMDVLVICCNTKGNWLFFKVSLQLSYASFLRTHRIKIYNLTKFIITVSFYASDFDVGGLEGRLQAVG